MSRRQVAGRKRHRGSAGRRIGVQEQRAGNTLLAAGDAAHTERHREQCKRCVRIGRHVDECSFRDAPRYGVDGDGRPDGDGARGDREAVRAVSAGNGDSRGYLDDRGIIAGQRHSTAGGRCQHDQRNGSARRHAADHTELIHAQRQAQRPDGRRAGRSRIDFEQLGLISAGRAVRALNEDIAGRVHLGRRDREVCADAACGHRHIRRRHDLPLHAAAQPDQRPPGRRGGRQRDSSRRAALAEDFDRRERERRKARSCRRTSCRQQSQPGVGRPITFKPVAGIDDHAGGNRYRRGCDAERYARPACRNEDARGQRDQVGVVVHQRHRDAAQRRRIQQRRCPHHGTASGHAVMVERNAPKDREQTERVLLPAHAVGGADRPDRGAPHRYRRDRSHRRVGFAFRDHDADWHLSMGEIVGDIDQRAAHRSGHVQRHARLSRVAAGNAGGFCDDVEDLQPGRRRRGREHRETLSRRPLTGDVPVNGAYAPEVSARREVIDALLQRVRHEHVVGAGDPPDQQHADDAREVRIVVDVDVVAGNLWVRRVGPVKRERE